MSRSTRPGSLEDFVVKGGYVTYFPDWASGARIEFVIRFRSGGAALFKPSELDAQAAGA